jgi:hypothetical protein
MVKPHLREIYIPLQTLIDFLIVRQSSDRFPALAVYKTYRLAEASGFAAPSKIKFQV